MLRPLPVALKRSSTGFFNSPMKHRCRREERGSLGSDGGTGSERPKPALPTLAHHIDEAWMRGAYGRVRTDAAANVEDVTAGQYETELDARRTEPH